MSSNPSDGRKRVVVIGLDGTPFSFLKKEMDAGNLPNLAALAANGRFSRMESEIPTISSVAWASFMTGKNPGEHGIYGFTDRKPGTYDLYFPNYTNLKAEPLWDRLSSEGKRCCVINVPSTFPARPLNGVLVSGFVAPNLERATYPASAYEYLQDMGYRIDVDAAKARESLDLLIDDLHATTVKRREAMFHFWESEKWDFFMCVFTGTDRLHHFMWKHYEDNDPVYAPEFLRYYKHVDGIIGEFTSGLPDDVSLIMLSDHGFQSIENEVYINRLLAEKGYLRLNREPAITIADMDASATRAYCMDPGRIYINLAGREPQGIVAEGDYEALRAELTEMLMGLKAPDSGKTVIADVIRREDLFSGPHAGTAPDLVAVSHDGFDLKGSMAQNQVFLKGHLTGMHTQDDAFLYTGNGLNMPENPSIRDVAGIILNKA